LFDAVEKSNGEKNSSHKKLIFLKVGYENKKLQ